MATDSNAVPPASAALVAGTRTFSLTFRTADYQTLTATWVSGTPSLSAGTSAIGQTIRVYFLGVEDSSLQTSFVIDDTALNVH